MVRFLTALRFWISVFKYIATWNVWWLNGTSMVLDGFVCVCLCVWGFVWKILPMRGLMGDGGVLLWRKGWADLAWVYTVSIRSLEERGEVIRDHVCPMCEACFDVLMCGCRLRSRDKIMGFWISLANVGAILGVKEDEQVGMSLKLGWKFCSNETTAYQARKEMACIAVGDWRLRLIELRNSFERISFFSVYELVYRSVSPQEAVTSTKLLKEAWVAEGERRTAPAGSTSSRRCSLSSRRRGRTNGFFM